MINEYVLLDGRGELKIGNCCSVSKGVVIYTGSHEMHSETFEYYTKKVLIEDGVWVCVNSVVLPGSVMKDYSVLSANSVFKGISEKNGLYVGIPAIWVSSYLGI